MTSYRDDRVAVISFFECRLGLTVTVSVFSHASTTDESYAPAGNMNESHLLYVFCDVVLHTEKNGMINTYARDIVMTNERSALWN